MRPCCPVALRRVLTCEKEESRRTKTRIIPGRISPWPPPPPRRTSSRPSSASTRREATHLSWAIFGPLFWPYSIRTGTTVLIMAPKCPKYKVYSCILFKWHSGRIFGLILWMFLGHFLPYWIRTGTTVANAVKARVFSLFQKGWCVPECTKWFQMYGSTPIGVFPMQQLFWESLVMFESF